MLPCSLDTSPKKDIGGLQYDIRGRAGGKRAQPPHTHTPQLLSVLSRADSALLQAWTPTWKPSPSSFSTLVTLSHPSSLLQPPVALPSCSFLSEHSVLSFPSPVASCNNAFYFFAQCKICVFNRLQVLVQKGFAQHHGLHFPSMADGWISTSIC